MEALRMGRVFLLELNGRAYRCRFCDTPLALADDVISRTTNNLIDDSNPVSFNCRQGRAYLFKNAVNIWAGEAEERTMLSGLHTVADIFCCCCGQLLGWKYGYGKLVSQPPLGTNFQMEARDKNQKYKEGKVVLERWRITEDSVIEYNLLDIRQSSIDEDYS
ncbi:hypothetical protein V2J09_019579 [Rumex salicifolius]